MAGREMFFFVKESGKWLAVAEPYESQPTTTPLPDGSGLNPAVSGPFRTAREKPTPVPRSS
jgi:hypothetical protein